MAKKLIIMNTEDILNKTKYIVPKNVLVFQQDERYKDFLIYLFVQLLLNLIDKVLFLLKMYLMEYNRVVEDVHVIDNKKVLIKNKNDDDQKNIHFLYNSNYSKTPPI
jgi:hypothetical protein